ncbi:ras and Rab interactor 3 [Xenentodon cancila]
MMEASVVSQDTGHSNPLTGALASSSISSSPGSPPSLISLPPSRPCRPKPPPHMLRSSQLPSRPPLPPSTPVSLPPPPPPPPATVSPPSLPPPLLPMVVSPSSPQSTVSSDVEPVLPPPTPLAPPSSSVVPPPSGFTPLPATQPSSSAPPVLSSIDQLVGSVSVWQLKGLSPEQTSNILEKETAGAFLVNSTEEKTTMISVRLPDHQGPLLVQNLLVKQHKSFVHLEGSSLVFDDIFKLVSFYCSSRDILTVPLKLPRSVTMTTHREDLEAISTMGPDFWTSDLNQQMKNQDHTIQPSVFMYVKPVPVEEPPSKDLHPSSTSKPETLTKDTVTSSLQNGEGSQSIRPQVNAPTKTNQEIKYKRPPPRPPSLGSGSGTGLLFSSTPALQISTAVTPQAEKKEEGKGGVGEGDERKSVSTSPPPPSRPPVPLQGRCAPPLPPAPLCRTSSRKSMEQETGREKGQNPAKKTEKEVGGERGKEKIGSRGGLVGEEAEQEAISQHEEDGVNKSGVEEQKEDKGVKMVKEDTPKSSPQCPPSTKKPSRPVPPPRTKPGFTDSPMCSSQAAGGLSNQSSGIRVPPPPSSARRPDVSLYSPQGGAALGPDPDSCSTSSTEEEGEPTQEQEQNHKSLAASRSPKAAVRRTPTTVMLDRARLRLSTVLTGLISHDRRLTKRIVELARDPQCYFGNLVKEHRAFTLETMSNHQTSTELLQEIRQMMTQLKSYLLQSTELQTMLEPQHSYTQDKLENIVEAALCKSVLKPLREPIYQTLEKLHSNTGNMKQLAQNQSAVLGSTTTALGITTSVPETSAMEKISIKLNRLHQEYSPQKKIELLLKTCKIIYDSMSVSCPGRAHGADDFLPVMMYVLARSNLSALQLDVEYMMELMDPTLTLGEGSYYLTTTYGALEHIKTFDQQRAATRQLSREVQDSIHRWERRRTLNQERMSQGSVRDFLTVYCPEIGTNPKTLGVFPSTTIQQLAEQCAARFEEDSYTLSVYMDDVQQPVTPTDLALSVKNSCQPGAYCFVYHPVGQATNPSSRTCPADPPPAPPTPNLFKANTAASTDAVSGVEEESLIHL